MNSPPRSNSTLLERHIRVRLLEALGESRAVCLLGPRQCGKSTLVRDLASGEHPAVYRTLDNASDRSAANADPTGFIDRFGNRSVIDEVQRSPRLLLAIKEAIDTGTDVGPGQFLITGSANILTMSSIADALPGRVDYLRLWPFTQGEIEGTREQFNDRLFAGDAPSISRAPIGPQAYIDRVVRGGYPGAYQRSQAGRTQFFRSYAATILGET